MTSIKFKELASKIAKTEGKKRQVSMGNIRETLTITLILLGKEMLTSLDAELSLRRQIKKYGKRTL